MVRAGRKFTIFLIVLCQSTQSLAFGAIALFLPLIREDVDLTFSQAGTLAVASTATYAVMQIPSGYLADRFGPRRLFVIGLLGTNAMSFLFAVLVTYEALLFNQALSGIFRSLVFAPGLVLITSHFAADRRATAMGLYVAGGFSSNVFLSLIGPALVGPLGWRLVFILSSSIAIATVLAYWWVGERGPDSMAANKVSIRQLLQLTKHPVLWASGVVQFVRLGLVQSIRFWLPTFLVVDRGFSLQVAGIAVAIGAVATAPANFLGGYVSDKLQRPLLVINVSLAVLAGCFVLLATMASLPVILVIVAVQSVFIQAYFGSLFEVPVRAIGSESAGTLNGFSNTCANIGGLVTAYALGAIKDATDSFALGWFSMAALCVVGLIAMHYVARMIPATPATLAEQSGSPEQPPTGNPESPKG